MAELLTEKYRPKTFDDILGRESQIEVVKNMLEKQGEINHLFLFGPAGTGKTTFAKAVANEIYGNEIKGNFYEFNASSDRGIEHVREDILRLAKERGFSSKPYKIILMDEADYITPDAQACFRRILEEYSKITRFIFTGNFPWKLIDALISRFTSIEFPKIDDKIIAKRLWQINKIENLGKSQDEVKSIAKKCNGDLRRSINLLQGGVVSSDIEKLEKLSLNEIARMKKDDRIALAFSGDPEQIYDALWEKVVNERSWNDREKIIEMMANCNYKMNISKNKTVFLAALLESIKEI